jgi:hypothetical protein
MGVQTREGNGFSSLKGQLQYIVVKAFGREVMSSAIHVQSLKIQKVAICKPFIQYLGEIGGLWVWHDSWCPGLLIYPQFLP